MAKEHAIFRINNVEVSKKEFESLKNELSISKDHDQTADLAPPPYEETYDGSEASYKAVHKTSGKEYRYTEVNQHYKDHTETEYNIQPAEE